MKRLFVILATAALMVSCGTSGKMSKQQDSIVVMSYNIRYGKAKDGDNAWENRKAATPAMLKDNAPVVFGIQEALTFQIDYILENCPNYATVGVGRDDGKEKGEHMSVFYDKKKVELIDWGTYWLSETPDVPSMGWGAKHYRTATWTLLKVKATGKKFYFVNTHLDHRSKEAQKNGLALIVERIGKMNKETYPMVLTGDFNITPDDPCLEDLDKMMKSARTFAASTEDMPSFNGWKAPKSVIDYIYYSGFKSCDSFQVVRQQYAGVPFISDHYPIKATLVF